ncbi:MAG: nodulation protein NfeD [Oceanicaulis sp.]
MTFGVRFIAGLLIAAGIALSAASGLVRQDAEAPLVMTAELRGPIGPATAAFITRAIDDADEASASALVVQMDTPGGLDSATRDINQAILGADVPVIVYVSPSGARAASAGAFITYASHLAAMAPGTSIGAATPIQMGGGGGGSPAPSPSPAPAEDAPSDAAGEDGDAQQTDEAAGDASPAAPSDAQALRNKVVNDAAAYIRSLADLRGRNADWAERAVREAVSASADEALELGVIEIVASDLEDLFAQAQGREMDMDGRTVTLEIEGARVEAIEKTFAEEALQVITDPNIAFLLLNLGFIGLLVSFYNGLEPITAIAGIICLIIGLYALNTLPLNYAGAALIVLGIALLVAEAFIASSGLLALGGLAAFAIGALMLMDTEVEAFRIDWRTIAAVTAVLGLSTFLLVSYGLAAQGRKVTTGDKGLIGQTGSVLEWSGDRGFVQVDGERWSAVSKDALSPGDAVKVTGIDGLTLKVKKA